MDESELVQIKLYVPKHVVEKFDSAIEGRYEDVKVALVDLMKRFVPSIFTAKVLDCGRVTLPDKLRSIHGIEKGDSVTCEILQVNKKEQKT